MAGLLCNICICILLYFHLYFCYICVLRGRSIVGGGGGWSNGRITL